jgi:hypothetical protein
MTLRRVVCICGCFERPLDHKLIVGYKCQRQDSVWYDNKRQYEGVGSVRDDIRVVGRGVCN